MNTRILVVDDSATVRQQVCDTLAAAGFETVQAIDGVDAIGKLDASVSLAICDINMPRLSGIEMLERIRADRRWDNVSVVMLTTEGQASLIARARKAGAKGWITKPFKPDLLLAAVRKLCA